MIREVELKIDGLFCCDGTFGRRADNPREDNCSVVVEEIYLLDDLRILADHGFHEVVVGRVEGIIRIKNALDTQAVLGFVT